MKLENNIRVLRKEFGLTQKTLCEEIEKQGYPIDRTTLSKYETGSHTFPCEFLVEIAKFFETTTDYILSLTDKK